MGYALVESAKREEWRKFGNDMLGMMTSDGPDGTLYLKMDERAHRFAILPGKTERFVATGWEVPDAAAFSQARKELEAAKVEVTPGTKDGAAIRKVQDYFFFKDPSGNGHEVFWGPISDFKRFSSPIGVRGFVTDRLGMGHSVLPALNYEPTVKFWTDIMGFGVSDILNIQIGPKLVRLSFMHCDNPRQHSLALCELPDPSGSIHCMVEVDSIDEVGYAFDRARELGVPLQTTMGRHVNDDMFSFYMYTPSGFAIEYGAGGKQIEDWSKTKVFETTRGSHWGHQFVQPPPGAGA